MTWADGRMCAFDIETTGTDVENDRIVTAALAGVGGDRDVRLWATLVNPGVEIPAGATEVHGVTTEQARASGEDPALAVTHIVDTLRRAVRAGVPIVAMNARFDLTILDREARRYGISPLATDELLVIDPFVIDKHVDRYRRGSRRLDALCAHYDARLDEAHHAASDAVAAARVAWRQGKTTKVGGMSLPELHAAQVGWAAEQAASLEEYFARKGDPQHVEPAWPVVPFAEARAAA